MVFRRITRIIEVVLNERAVGGGLVFYWTGIKIQGFYVILENFCLCLIQRTLGELPNFGVMIWQLYYMLRSALICFQVTRFRNKGNHFI